ncbi:MAG: hypothetical protein ABIR54_05355 [Burkholderiaceae bacterium]
MKRTLIAAAGLTLFAASGLASAASWSVIVEPGVYGRVAIGGYIEAPQVYTPQPVVAIDNGYGQVVEEFVDPAYATDQTPVYLWVPEYQRLHWAQYCREYGAYGVPVYFVDDGWYRANVMRRNWTPEQRSWSQRQWLDQDRLARDRFERQRFENQRYEQQRHWSEQREWQEHPHQQRRSDDQDRMRWGSAHAYVPLPQQNGQPSYSQPGGQWQQHGGQWQQHGGQWQQPGNGGQQGGYRSGNGDNNANPGNGGHHGGNQPGNDGNNGGNPGNPGNGGYGGHQVGGQPGNDGRTGGHQGGNQPGNGGNNAGNGGHAGNVGSQQPQPPAAQLPYGPGRAAPVQNGGDRRGDERGQDRGDRRGQGEARGSYEHGRGGNRDR